MFNISHKCYDFDLNSIEKWTFKVFPIYKH